MTVSASKATLIAMHQDLSTKLDLKVYTTSTLARRPVAEVEAEVRAFQGQVGEMLRAQVDAECEAATAAPAPQAPAPVVDEPLPGEELALDDEEGLEATGTSTVVATTDAEGLQVQRVAMGMRAPAKPRKATTPRQVAHPHHMVIRLVASTNPKRVGTPAHEEWEMYVDGMTVAEYITVVKANSRSMQADRRGYNGVAHDVKKGFIRLEEPK